MTALPPQFFLYFPNRHSTADPHSGFVLMNATLEENAWRIMPVPQTTTQYTLTPPSQQFTILHSLQLNVHHEAEAGLILKKTICEHGIQIVGPQATPVRVFELIKHTTVFVSILKRNVKIVSTPAPAPVPAPKKSPAVISITPHVARQLLELARLKHDTCPIIMEELMEGHTAAMPCGHLFSRLAIEESFKKEPATCPACRQKGEPAYV